MILRRTPVPSAAFGRREARARTIEAPRRGIARTLAIASLVAAAGGCARRSSPSPAPSLLDGGTLLIVGGGTQPPELVERFVRLAGGAGHARIAVLPMASEDVEASAREKADQLHGLGADAFVVNVTHAEADADSVVRRMDSVTGVWFPGGDQVRLANVLRGTRLLQAIRARFAAGAVIGGTSAGAAVMSDSMLTGNQHRAGVDTSGYFGDEFPAIGRHTIEVTAGFGFLHGAIVDQHFIRRERQNRLMSVVLERPSLIGVGIDESTALEVHPGGPWQVVGAGSVIVYDARSARLTSLESNALGAIGVRLHVLPSGSTFDPRGGDARLPGH